MTSIISKYFTNHSCVCSYCQPFKHCTHIQTELQVTFAATRDAACTTCMGLSQCIQLKKLCGFGFHNLGKKQQRYFSTFAHFYMHLWKYFKNLLAWNLWTCYLFINMSATLGAAEVIKLVSFVTVILSASPSPSTLSASTVNRYTSGATQFTVNIVLVVWFTSSQPVVLWNILCPLTEGLDNGYEAICRQK